MGTDTSGQSPMNKVSASSAAARLGLEDRVLFLANRRHLLELRLSRPDLLRERLDRGIEFVERRLQLDQLGLHPVDVLVVLRNFPVFLNLVVLAEAGEILVRRGLRSTLILDLRRLLNR